MKITKRQASAIARMLQRVDDAARLIDDTLAASSPKQVALGVAMKLVEPRVALRQEVAELRGTLAELDPLLRSVLFASGG